MSTENKNTQVAEVRKKDISAVVLSKIEDFQKTGELRIPKGYSPENALKSAYLILSETKNSQNKYALEYCTKESVANALLKMVVWGLSPLKKQCDFIMYGDKLDCSIEYTGNIALAKRYGKLKDIKANAVFEGDEFAFELDPSTGRRKVTKHSQTLESMGSKKVKGAYAVMEFEDGSQDAEIMSIEQIKDAWNQGAMKGNSPAHKNFPDQMAMKTVINRACKMLIRGSDDSVLYSEDEDKTIDVASADVNYEVRKKANRKPIAFDEEVVYEEVPASEDDAEEEENERLYQEAMAEENKQTAPNGQPQMEF